MVMARSAVGGSPTTAEVVLELLPGTGSVVADETVAVFTTGSGVVYEIGNEYVVVMVPVAPAATVPSAQG